jgi:hypothetical protein
VSSGYSVGSCNWVIQSEYEKVHAIIAIISAGSGQFTVKVQKETNFEK